MRKTHAVGTRGLIAGLLVALAACGPAEEPLDEVGRLRQQVVSWIEAYRAEDSTDRTAEVEQQGLSLFVRYGEAMRKLLGTDGERAFAAAVDKEYRLGIPGALLPHLATAVSGTASLERLVVEPEGEGAAAADDLLEMLAVDRVPYSLFHAPEAVKRLFESHPTVDVRAVHLADELFVVSGQPAVPSSESTATVAWALKEAPGRILNPDQQYNISGSTGVVKLLRLDIYPSDNPPPALSAAEIRTLAKTWTDCLNKAFGPPSLEALRWEVTYPGPIQVDLPSGSSSSAAILEAWRQLEAQGIRGEDFNVWSYHNQLGFDVMCRGACGGGGARGGFTYASRTCHTHEIGHALGLGHSNAWVTRRHGRTVIGPGISSEYAGIGMMGGSHTGAFTVWERYFLGWLTDRELPEVSRSGTHVIRDRDLAQAGQPMGLKIPAPSRRRTYTVEYAPQLSPLHADGVYAIWGSSTSNSWGFGETLNVMSMLTAEARNSGRRVLPVGMTLSDWDAGLHITPTRRVGDDAIEVHVEIGQFASNRPPVIDALNVSSRSPAHLETVRLSVSATDPDDDPLSYHWDLGKDWDMEAGGIAAAYTEDASFTYIAPGYVGAARRGRQIVQVWVSDRKGGVATRRVVLGGEQADGEDLEQNPQVQWIAPGGRSVRVATNGKLQLRARATDNRSLESFELFQSEGITLQRSRREPIGLAALTGAALDPRSTELASEWDAAGGSYQIGDQVHLLAVAKDEQGNPGTALLTATLIAPGADPTDQSPPVVRIESPSSGALIERHDRDFPNVWVALRFKATDDQGIGAFQVDFDATKGLKKPWLEGRDEMEESVRVVVWADDGPHRIRLHVWDKAANQSTTDLWISLGTEAPTPTPDTTAPSVPQDVRAVGVSASEIRVAWSASSDDAEGSGMAGYAIQRNGNQVAQVGLTTSYSDRGLDPSTSHSYQVVALDLAGNRSALSSAAGATTAAAATDDVAPTVWFTAPAAGTTIELGETTVVQVAASDNVGVARVTLYSESTKIATFDQPPYQTDWSTTGLTAGAHQLRAEAVDRAGNKASVTLSLTLEAKAEDPVPTPSSGFRITYPADGSLVSVRRAVWMQLAALPAGSHRLRLLVDGVVTRNSFAAGGHVPWIVPNRGGAYELTVRALDRNGRPMGETSTVTVHAR